MRNFDHRGWARNFVALGTLLVALVGSQVRATQAPQIASRAELVYPPMARAAGITGDVVIDLDIRPDGTVETASTFSGHPLLAEPTRKTVASWTFDPSPRAESRSLRLFVSFGDVSESDDGPVGTQITYVGYDSIYISYIQSTISRLPRDADGSVSLRNCPVHDEQMRLDIVPIRYGLPTMTVYADSVEARLQRHRERSYDKARKSSFPETNRWVGGGCNIQVERKAEVMYCQTCRDNQDRWHSEHPTYPRNDY